MILNPYRFGMPTGTWNALDKASSINLSAGNTVASTSIATTPTYRSVRGAVGRNTGIRQFELSASTLSNSTEYYIGVADSSCSLISQPLDSSLGGKYAVLRLNTQLYSDGGFAGAPGATISAAPHIYGVVANLSTRAVTFYVDGVYHSGVSYGTGGGDMIPFLTIGSISTSMTLELNTDVSEIVYPVGGAIAWG